MKLNLRKILPEILTGIGVIGTVTTAILAAKETPKAIKILNRMSFGVETFEKVKEVAPVYIPAAVSGLITVSAIIGAQITTKRQLAALAGAYSLAAASYTKYKDKAKKVLKDATGKIDELMEKEAPKMPETVTPGKELFYDDYSERYFESTTDTVKQAFYDLNKKLAIDGYASLNDLYGYLGIEGKDFGEYTGWETENMREFYGCPWIDYSLQTDFHNSKYVTYIYFTEIPGPVL